MSSITRKINIKAPVSKVFEFMTNHENWTKYVTSLINVKDLSSQVVEKGTTFRWTYRMLGINFHGKGYVTEYIKNKKFGLKMEGSFPITETYTFNKTDEGTELVIEINYEPPGKIMGLIKEKGLLDKINKKEAENVLNKIKLLCEGV